MPKKTNNDSKGKKNNDAVFDVAKPGKTAPNTGSRPIIVTHKPMVQDPMVKDKEDKTDPEEKPTLGPPEVTSDKKNLGARGKKRLSLSPLSDEEKTENPETGTVIKPEKNVQPEDDKSKAKEIEDDEEAVKEVIKTEDTKKPSSIEGKAAETDVNSGQTEKTEETEKVKDTDDNSEIEESQQDSSADEESADEKQAKDDEKNPKKDDKEKNDNEDTKGEEETGLVDELAKQAASKKQQKEEDKAAAAQKEKLDEIIAAKTYYVPTAQVTKRRVKYGLLIVVLLAFIAIGLNFALDAGYIDIGVSPVTDVIAD